MTEEELERKKKVLIEKLGVQLEQLHKMPPVAARIFSMLILTGKEGVTFDGLVQELNASKSTISTNLENLQATGKITYFTKPGDRKRYFITDSNLIFNLIDEMVERWETEKQIHRDILSYKKESNKLQPKKEQKFDLDFNRNYLTFLDEATTAIQKLRTNMILKQETANNNSQQ